MPIVYPLEKDDAKETQRIVEAEGQRVAIIQAYLGSRKLCGPSAVHKHGAVGLVLPASWRMPSTTAFFLESTTASDLTESHSPAGPLVGCRLGLV